MQLSILTSILQSRIQYAAQSRRCVARIWKRWGFFERVKKLQTTLTRIFVVLESESHGLSENWEGNFGQYRKFKRFSAQKQVIFKKKKKKGLNWDGFFGLNRKFKRFFSAKTGDLKKVFTETETDFSTKIGNSNAISGRITTSTSQLRHPISFGGGCFHFFIKNRPQKHQKRAILHTLQANGEARAPPAPPPPPGYATAISCLGSGSTTPTTNQFSTV